MGTDCATPTTPAETLPRGPSVFHLSQPTVHSVRRAQRIPEQLSRAAELADRSSAGSGVAVGDTERTLGGIALRTESSSRDHTAADFDVSPRLGTRATFGVDGSGPHAPMLGCTSRRSIAVLCGRRRDRASTMRHRQVRIIESLCTAIVFDCTIIAHRTPVRYTYLHDNGDLATERKRTPRRRC